MPRVMSEHVDAFVKRPLENRCVCVYLDATYIAVKRDTVSKEAVHIAIGIREDGSMEVLAYTIAPTESAYMWKALREDIKQRGIEQALLFISDGLRGIVNAMETGYPQSKYQTCCIHLSRNIAHKVRLAYETQFEYRHPNG